MDILIFYAVPVFLLFIAVEAWWTARAGRPVYERRDTLASLAMAVDSSRRSWKLSARCGS